MKAKVMRPDGTILELEGTADEIVKVVGAPAQPIQFVPVWTPPAIFPQQPILPAFPSPWPSPPPYYDIIVSTDASSGPAIPNAPMTTSSASPLGNVH